MVKLILFFCTCLLLSCNNSKVKPGVEDSNETTILSKDSISYELFPVGTGYGFNILKGGKVYIHQPFIPTWEGFQKFPTKESADALASLILQKLIKKNFRFLLEKPEVDSLMRKYFVSNVGTNKIEESKNETFIHSINTIKFRQAFIWQLPVLKDFPVKNKWASKGIVPFGARAGMMNFSIKNCIYIGAGELKDLKTRDTWRYNADLNFWTCMAEFPGDPMMGGVGFSLYDNGYWSLGTGYKKGLARFLKDLYEYNATMNIWTKREDFPGAERTDATGFTINNKAYIGLGYAKGYRADMYEYDPASKKRWKKIADFEGGPVSSSIGVGLSDKGFIIAGDSASNNQKFVYEYLPLVDKWEKTKDLPGHARYFLNGCFIDSNIFITGGGGAEGGEIKFRDFYVFDDLKNEWFRAENYPVSKNGISRAVSGNANGKVYLGTGFNGSYLNDWNVFEYYFSVRTDTGNYNETTCYPLQYNGKWELYQECNNDDCFAGFQLKSSQALGNLCYSSHFKDQLRNITLSSNQRNNFFILPRNFVITTSNQPQKPILLRLFFTKAEIEKAITACNEKDGTVHTLNDIQVLQSSEAHPDIEPSNNSFRENTYKFIKLQWFSYGFNGETMVAEFPVTSLHSEFYLTVPAK